MLFCPNCTSSNVMTTSVQRFDANTFDYLYEAVKPHDFDSPAKCRSCDFEGVRSDLIEDANENA